MKLYVMIRRNFSLALRRRLLILCKGVSIFVAFSFSSNPVFSQDISTALNPWMRTDTTGKGIQIKRLIKEANGLAQQNLETALQVLDSAFKLIQIAPDLRAYTVYLGNGGLILVNNGRNEEATYWLELSVELAKRNRWKSLERKLINVVAVNNMYLGKYDSALHSGLKYLNLSLAAKDSVDISIAYLNLGTLYHKLYDPINALSYYFNAKEAGTQRNNALLYYDIGFCYNNLEKFDSALLYFELGNRKCIPECTNANMISYNLGKGVAFRYLNNFDSALYYLTRARKIAEQKNDERSLAENAVMLAEVNIEMHNFIRARSLLQFAEFLSQKNSFMAVELEVYFNFVLLFDSIGDIERKSLYQSRYINQTRIIYNEELLSKIALMEAENNESGNFKKIEAQKLSLAFQNSLTESRNKVLFLVGIAAGLLLAVLVFLIIANQKNAILNVMLEHLVEEQTIDLEESFRYEVNAKSSLEHAIKFLFSDLRSQLATLKGFCLVGSSDVNGEEKKILAGIFSNINDIEVLGRNFKD